MEQKEFQRHDEQRKLFNEAVDAIEDLTSGMYAVGNSRNVSRKYGVLAGSTSGEGFRSQVSTGAGLWPLTYLQHCFRPEHSFVSPQLHILGKTT